MREVLDFPEVTPTTHGRTIDVQRLEDVHDGANQVCAAGHVATQVCSMYGNSQFQPKNMQMRRAAGNLASRRLVAYGAAIFSGL